jgi:hypothetical protein
MNRFAAALQELLATRDLAQGRGRAAAGYAGANFTAGRLVHGIDRLYRRMLCTPSPPLPPQEHLQRQQ